MIYNVLRIYLESKLIKENVITVYPTDLIKLNILEPVPKTKEFYAIIL